MSLGALSGGRVGIAGMAGINMGKALTIAIRLELNLYYYYTCPCHNASCIEFHSD